MKPTIAEMPDNIKSIRNLIKKHPGSSPEVTEEWISQMAASLVPVIGTLAERRVKSCLEITALHSTLCGEIKKLMLQNGVKVKEGK